MAYKEEDCQTIAKRNIQNSESNNRIKLSRLGRIDRILRRWLPGYKYLRACKKDDSISEVGSNSFSMQEQRIEDDPGYVAFPQLREGDVYMDAGISKSEFCRKLEKLLQERMLRDKI